MLKDNLGLTLCILIAIASIGFALFSGDPYYVQVVIWVFTNAVLAVTLRFVPCRTGDCRNNQCAVRLGHT